MARVVHDCVDASEPVEGSLDERGQIFLPAYGALDSDTLELGRQIEDGLRARHETEPVPLCGQSPGARLADAAARGGHNGDERAHACSASIMGTSTTVILSTTFSSHAARQHPEGGAA